MSDALANQSEHSRQLFTASAATSGRRQFQRIRVTQPARRRIAPDQDQVIKSLEIENIFKGAEDMAIDGDSSMNNYPMKIKQRPMTGAAVNNSYVLTKHNKGGGAGGKQPSMIYQNGY